jgi:LysM repeat protein
MYTQEFIDKNQGQFLNVTNNPGNQCEDLAIAYNEEVIGGTPLLGNAIDALNSANYDTSKYEFVANTPEGVPSFGDLVIWGQGIGEYGHIAVFISGDTNQFSSFDQNFPLESACHVQGHDYSNVAGWLHVTDQSVIAAPVAEPEAPIGPPAPVEVPQAPVEAPAAPTAPADVAEHTVVDGDTLGQIIADHYNPVELWGPTGKVAEVAAFNGIDPNATIEIGQVIKLP